MRVLDNVKHWGEELNKLRQEKEKHQLFSSDKASVKQAGGASSKTPQLDKQLPPSLYPKEIEQVRQALMRKFNFSSRFIDLAIDMIETNTSESTSELQEELHETLDDGNKALDAYRILEHLKTLLDKEKDMIQQMSTQEQVDYLQGFIGRYSKQLQSYDLSLEDINLGIDMIRSDDEHVLETLKEMLIGQHGEEQTENIIHLLEKLSELLYQEDELTKGKPNPYNTPIAHKQLEIAKKKGRGREYMHAPQDRADNQEYKKQFNKIKGYLSSKQAFSQAYVNLRNHIKQNSPKQWDNLIDDMLRLFPNLRSKYDEFESIFKQHVKL